MIQFRSTLVLALALASGIAMASPVTGVESKTISYGVMSHKMFYEGKTVFEATSTMSEPPPKRLQLDIRIGDFYWECPTLENGISTDAGGDRGNGEVVDAFMIACGIRQISAGNTTKVDVIYVKKDKVKGSDISEHFAATVTANKKYETRSKTGEKVTLLLKLP